MSPLLRILATLLTLGAAILLFAVLTLGLTSCGGSSSPKPPPLEAGPAPAAPTDLSGSVGKSGGMILDKKTILHSTHWPHKVGDTIRLKTRTGRTITRTITRKHKHGGDVATLTIDPPLDLTQHTLIPLAPARLGPVLILRLDRPPLTTNITRATRTLHVPLTHDPSPEAEKIRTGTNPLRLGDSSKQWLQNHDGQTRLIGLTHRADKNQSPHLARYLPQYLPPKKPSK